MLLLHYYYYNCNALPGPRDARRANTTLLLRQLQHAAMFTVLLLQYYYDNYNTLPCLPCYYYSTTTTTAKRFRAHRAYTTLLLLQLQCTAMPAVMLFVLTLH